MIAYVECLWIVRMVRPCQALSSRAGIWCIVKLATHIYLSTRRWDGQKKRFQFLRSSFQLKNLSFNPSIKSDLINQICFVWDQVSQSHTNTTELGDNKKISLREIFYSHCVILLRKHYTLCFLLHLFLILLVTLITMAGYFPFCQFKLLNENIEWKCIFWNSLYT